MFNPEQKQRIEAAFFKLYDEATAEMELPWANPREKIHYTLWISSDVDKVVLLWYGSMFAYCILPETQRVNYDCSLTDYRKRFCGAYLHPDEFLQNDINYRVAKFVKENTGKLEQFDHKKIISDTEAQTRDSYYQIDTQWVSNELQMPQLNLVDMCFVFKR